MDNIIIAFFLGKVVTAPNYVRASKLICPVVMVLKKSKTFNI